MKKIIIMLLLLNSFILGQTDYALNFDGTDDYVLVPDNNTLDVTTAITIEAWVKLDVTPYFSRIVIKPYEANNTVGKAAYFLGFDKSKSYPRFGITTTTGHKDFYDTTSVPLNSWTHIAGTYSSGSGDMKLYVNGSLVKTVSHSGNILTTDFDLTIGGSSYDGNSVYYELDGLLDDVRIWNVERTGAEINDNKDSELTGTETGLVAYYKMSDGSGTTLTDDCTNSNDGTLMDNTSWMSDSPLPVELTIFSAAIINNNVVVSWETATEVNNYGFDVERRIETGEWNRVGFVEGHGNSNSPKSYSYLDNTIAGKYFYRLKQIDIDGLFRYSDVVEVDLNSPTEFELKQNFPNPFNPTTSIQFSLPEATQVKLVVFNVIGEQVVELVNENMEAGYHNVQFNASEFNSGIYIYKLEANNFIKNRKMMLIK